MSNISHHAVQNCVTCCVLDFALDFASSSFAQTLLFMLLDIPYVYIIE